MRVVPVSSNVSTGTLYCVVSVPRVTGWCLEIVSAIDQDITGHRQQITHAYLSALSCFSSIVIPAAHQLMNDETRQANPINTRDRIFKHCDLLYVFLDS